MNVLVPRLACSLLSGFVIASLCHAQAREGGVAIRAIHLSGNHAFNDRELLDVVFSKPSRRYSSQQIMVDKENLLQKYYQAGYCFANVDVVMQQCLDDSSQSEVTFVLREGKQVAIDEILLSGNSALTNGDILGQFLTKVDGILDTKVLEQDIQSLLSRYERRGYPFANVEVKDITVTDEQGKQGLCIALTIDEGAKVLINEVRVQGNKETSEHVILREARIVTSELYDEDKVSKISQRLNRLNIFSSVYQPQLYITPRGGGLLISVEEGNTNTFDGVIGYVPGGTGDESGFVTGMVHVTMRNLFGTARKFDVRWQRDDRYSQEFDIRYVEPWVFDVPINVSGSFFQRQQDTLYVKRVVGAKADVLLSDVVSLGAFLNGENTIPSATISAPVVSDSRTITAGVEFHYDSRDDIVSPTTGVNYLTDYQIGNKKVYGMIIFGSDRQNAVQKISFDAESYVEPFGRQVVALGVHGKQITSDNIELGDYYRFGGTNTLRGYRENQFIGSRIAWANTEYRFLLARHTFCYGFFDAGYYFLPSDDLHGLPSAQSLKYGYGIGVRLETSLGNIGVSIALGQGDSFSQAKLHVGLINNF